MKKLILPSLVFMAMSLAALNANAGPSCQIVFATKTNLTETIKESLKLRGKADTPSYQISYEGSPAEKLWAEKAMKIETKAQAVSLVTEIITSLRFLSTGQWQTVMENAMPVLLTRMEALDNMGVLDIAAITDIAKAQLQRAENFSDPTFANTLLKHFSFTKDESAQRKVDRTDLFALVESRQQKSLSFRRSISGVSAEQLYLAFNLPEIKSQGQTNKILRATDRSVILEMSFEEATGQYFATLKGDLRSLDQSESREVYRFNINSVVRDFSFIRNHDSFNSVTQALDFTDHVRLSWGKLVSVSIQNSDGKPDIELSATNKNVDRNERDLETEYSGKFFIEVPKNRDVYQGRETLRSYQADLPENRAKARASKGVYLYRLDGVQLRELRKMMSK